MSMSFAIGFGMLVSIWVGIPLVVRFVLVKKPLTKPWAATAAAGLYVVNAILLTLADAADPSILWVLLAFAAYGILRIGARHASGGGEPLSDPSVDPSNG